MPERQGGTRRAAEAAGASRPRRGWAGLTSAARREAMTGYAFVAPSVLGFLLFVLGPVVAAIGLSLTRYDVLRPPRFVGFDNYVAMLRDDRLIQTYGNTFVYVVAAVVLINLIALGAAVLVTQHMPRRLSVLFRSAYFFPYLVALVYVSIIWQAMFQKDTGIINYYLSQLGIAPVDWLNSPSMSRVTVIVVDTWRNIGFAMLIYVAALHEVPGEMLEAAEIDGAGPWQRFRRVTLPMISQATFFNITTTVIGAFQIYESIIVLTRGGPGDSSRSVVMYLAERAFGTYDMGYASAIAVSLFVLILAVTLVQFRLRRKWVHYE